MYAGTDHRRHTATYEPYGVNTLGFDDGERDRGHPKIKDSQPPQVSYVDVRLSGMQYGLRDRMGDYLRALRRAAKLSQRELAKASRVNKNTIARLEAERHFDPRLSTLEQLAAVAGWVVVFADEGGRIVAPYPGDVTLDEAGRELPAHLESRERGQALDWWGRSGGYTFERRTPGPAAGGAAADGSAAGGSAQG